MSAWISLAIILLVVGATGVLAISAIMARILLRPPRMTDGKAFVLLRRTSPADLGLMYEPIDFEIPDAAAGGRAKLPVASWWIPAPAPSQHTAVLIHGYMDAKIGAIAWAPLFRSMGYNIFAYDLRAHGQSGGRYGTAGFFEKDDLGHILQELRTRLPRETGRIVLLGVSLGGAVAAATAADAANGIAAVILESPFADFRDAFISRASAQGAPGPLFQYLAFWMARKISRADFSAVRPPEMIRRCSCPVMVIESGDDLLDAKARSAIASAVADRRQRGLPTATYVAPAAWHVTGLAENPAAYSAAIAEFLESLP